MARIRILTENDLRQAVTLDESAVDCIRDAFRALSQSKVVMPPILRLDIPEHRGEVDVKTAYIPGLDGFAIKISPGFFNNPQLGLSSTNGLMVLLSTQTGLVQALLLDNGYLTDIRTAAAGAVAADCLARPDARVATIFGAGMQARMQLEALTLVRPVEEARIWARDFAKASSLATRMTGQLGIPVRPVADARSAVEGSDIIVTTTPSTEPLLMADWVVPGQHVTAMGSDAEHKNEVDPALVCRADLYVADRCAQTSVLGELHHAIAAGLVSQGRTFAELGDVISGKSGGRSFPDSITYADLTGTGIQDTAIATLAFSRATAAGAGTAFDS